MKKLILIVFILSVKISYSQTLIADAVKLQTAFNNLSKEPGSKKLQQAYITAFPSDTNAFLAVFQNDKFQQLNIESFKYLAAFEMCATNFPTEVIGKCIDIGKNLVWDADAVGELQHISVDLAIKYIKIFIDKYKTLDDKEQDNLITFYADVENHAAYPEYKELINKLNAIGEKEIAQKLETARTIRMNKQDH